MIEQLKSSTAAFYGWIHDHSSSDFVAITIQVAITYIALSLSALAAGLLINLLLQAANAGSAALVLPLSRRFPVRNTAEDRQSRRHAVFAPAWGFGVIVAFHSITARIGGAVTAVLSPFARRRSILSLLLSIVIVSFSYWPQAMADGLRAATDFVPPIDSPQAATMASIGTLVVALIPLAVLVFLLFSRTGLVARSRDNSALVSESTRELANFQTAMILLADAAYSNRSHAVESRESRAISSIDRGSSGTVLWLEGEAPRAYASEALFTPHEPRLQDTLDAENRERSLKAVRGAQRVVNRVQKNGLGTTCAWACLPVRDQLSRLHVHFRPQDPRAKVTSFFRLLDFNSLLDEAYDDLQKNIARYVRRSATPDRFGRQGDALFARAGGSDGRTVTAIEAEHIEWAIAHTGKRIDFLILEHRLDELAVWRCVQHLDVNILGNAVDTLRNFIAK
ncbi:hypothetical protein [Georgenia wangjunii]|uniref:hypothetical protein n=1 Tax=Georgenia wangjunii TaxID=3117730 RepID=UPI002F26A834